MGILLRILGLFGVVIFACGFGLTFGAPDTLERAAKGFIKNRIVEETQQKIDQLDFTASDNPLIHMAGKLVQQNQAKIDHLKTELDNKVHEKVAVVVAEMSDLSCECREKFANRLKQGAELSILSLQNINEKLGDFMRGQYMQVVTKLKTELRIFTGGNVIVFALLLLISFFKPKAITHLFVPGVLLLVSTLVCSYCYLFEQNWFFTILYSDYMGFTYWLYLGLVFAFLSDIVLNRAKITSCIINNILNAAGSASSVTPC